MSILYLLIPLMLLVAGGALAAFVWAARDGQLDDLDTPPLRMLADDHATGGDVSRSPRAAADSREAER